MKMMSENTKSEHKEIDDAQLNNSFDVFEPLISAKEDWLSKSCHKPKRSWITVAQPSMCNILDQEKQDLLTRISKPETMWAPLGSPTASYSILKKPDGSVKRSDVWGLWVDSLSQEENMIEMGSSINSCFEEPEEKGKVH